MSTVVEIDMSRLVGAATSGLKFDTYDDDVNNYGDNDASE